LSQVLSKIVPHGYRCDLDLVATQDDVIVKLRGMWGCFSLADFVREIAREEVVAAGRAPYDPGRLCDDLATDAEVFDMANRREPITVIDDDGIRRVATWAVSEGAYVLGEAEAGYGEPDYGEPDYGEPEPTDLGGLAGAIGRALAERDRRQDIIDKVLDDAREERIRRGINVRVRPKHPTIEDDGLVSEADLARISASQGGQSLGVYRVPLAFLLD
jgi:hypothetical protein